MRTKYRNGKVVWLRAMTAEETGHEPQPREMALVYGGRSGSYTGAVRPHEYGDDGLRDFFEDQIEGPASRKERAHFLATYKKRVA